jgi:hypothetical protein
MRTPKCAIGIVAALLASTVGSAAVIESLLHSVVYLKTDRIETIEQNGRRFEIWLRDPTVGKRISAETKANSREALMKAFEISQIRESEGRSSIFLFARIFDRKSGAYDGTGTKFQI